MRAELPTKHCVVCGRTITWRKKWERDWEQVKYCSDACRRSKTDETDVALERGIVRLLGERQSGGTICPSEVARAVGSEDEHAWRALMPRVRQAANRLAARDVIEFTQGGRVVDPSTARGPVRLGLRR